eukprot:gene44267-48982_t
MAGRLRYVPPFVSVDRKGWAATTRRGAVAPQFRGRGGGAAPAISRPARPHPPTRADLAPPATVAVEAEDHRGEA